ncbi:hypothetical protein EJ04DRAFT_555699 [Polyplosphaeria fusca]|uniref:U6 snRNA phosphodiesterase n=1 Tax=Polyplosphaeria fusca TaxID=682080 RepID=A0A9P4UZC6_9PLEO|nr:hypothetical protein EJ04DRAFT_555699 [Polyplosphaeria fusca]
MPLVLYPDSDDDDDCDDDCANEVSIGPKRKRAEPDPELPPLPSTFLDLYSTNARLSTTDDPSLHGGRKRAVPHIQGNWPSHVYLEWNPSDTESAQLSSLIEAVKAAIEPANKARRKALPVPDLTPSLLSPLGTPLPLHISLSRTLSIPTEDRTTFLDTLKACLRKSAVAPFKVRFDRLKWVPNYDRTRWFLILSIARPARDQLNNLLRACNEAAEKCGHPGLYTGGAGDGPTEDNTPGRIAKKARKDSDGRSHQETGREHIDFSDRFHVSIAWNFIEPDPEWISLLDRVDVTAHITQPDAPFENTKVKIGNNIHSIDLASRKASSSKRGGLLGLG